MEFSTYAARTLKPVMQELSDVVCAYKWHIVGGVAVAGAVTALFKTRRTASWMVNLTKRNVNDGWRQTFNKRFVFKQTKAPPNSHSHPTSASNRTDAERSIDDFIISNGYKPFSVSTSARDADGTRFVYSAKDLDLDYKNDKLTKNHIVRMIDVDYYADVEYWLWRGRPVILYTFAPNSVGGPTTEGIFRVADDKVILQCNGGACYTHALWDYNLDHFIIKGKFWNLMVKVDQVKVPGDPDRRIVCLTPRTWTWAIFSWLYEPANTLKRRKISYGEANINAYTVTDSKGTKNMVSIAFKDTPYSVNIPYATAVSICKRLGQAKHPNITDVERYLSHDKFPDAAIAAPLVYEAFLGGWCRIIDEVRVGIIGDCGYAATAPHYQTLSPLVTEEGNDIGVQVWKPVITGCGIFPKSSYNNDAACIKGRIDDVANKTDPPPIYHKWMKEFIQAFPMAELNPTSIDYVIEQQNKPLQKIRCEMNKHFVGHQRFHVKSFMKKESYPKATDPRNISTCPPSHTMELSTFTYAAKEIFKRYPWFMPGKTPSEIAAAVQDMCIGEQHVMSSDFSRLDGTISAFLRLVERGVYLRLFKEKHRQRLAELLDAEISCKAHTATGQAYDPGASRLSGSPLTTDGNTIIVAFVVYCAMRKANMIKIGDILSILAIIYGDDEMTKKIPKHVLLATARALGLTLKVTEIPHGEPVEFLARIFVDPWSTLTSIQNPRRALGKLHMSVVRNIDARIVANHKATGYLAMDPYTPILSDYCYHILRKTRDVTEAHKWRIELIQETPWWVQQFENDSWPQDFRDKRLMEKAVADNLEISVDMVRELCDQIRRDDWSPLEYEIESSVSSVITGDGEPRLASRASV